MKIRLYLLLAYIVFVVIALIIGANVGISEGNDAFYYIAIAELVFFKVFIPIGPFNVHTPKLLYPPLFGGIAILFSYYIPAGYNMIAWILFQFFLVFASGICIATMARDIIGKKYGSVAFIIFFALPFLFIYATTLWTEVFCIFLLSLYLRLLMSIISKKTSLWPSTLVLLSSVMTLTKLNFVTLFVFSLILWITLTCIRYSHDSLRKLLLMTIPACIGICGIGAWVLFVYHYTGVLELSTNSQSNLFAGAVSEGKLLPPETSSEYKALTKWVPKDKLLEPRWWIFDDQFVAPFNNGQLTEADIDALKGNFAKAAVKTHPLEYIALIIKNHVTLALSTPLVWNLYGDLGATDQVGNTFIAKCRTAWNNNLCSPLYNNPQIVRAWIQFVRWQNSLYPYPALLLYCVGYIGIISAVIKRNERMIIIVIVYYCLLLEHAAVSSNNYGRYFITVYPMYALLITYGIQTITQGWEIVQNKIHRKT